jgi:hypothetical protein
MVSSNISVANLREIMLPREEKRRSKKGKSEKVRRNKMKVHEKEEKSRNTVFFQ